VGVCVVEKSAASINDNNLRDNGVWSIYIAKCSASQVSALNNSVDARHVPGSVEKDDGVCVCVCVHVCVCVCVCVCGRYTLPSALQGKYQRWITLSTRDTFPVLSRRMTVCVCACVCTCVVCGQYTLPRVLQGKYQLLVTLSMCDTFPASSRRMMVCACACVRVYVCACVCVCVVCCQYTLSSAVQARYGVATISRLLTIIGLFCKTAL